MKILILGNGFDLAHDRSIQEGGRGSAPREEY